VLGGSSSLNGVIYVRVHRTDYDHWAYLGNAGWDYESLLPYFKRSEDFDRGASRYHGQGVPCTCFRSLSRILSTRR
jgi:choline dehydrogenase